jgi:hypothetical protein
MAKSLLCTTCHHVGAPRRITRGSFWVEVLAWLLFLLPGLIYSLWRLGTRYDGCAACGSRDLIPLDSPRARQLLAGAGSTAATPGR